MKIILNNVLIDEMNKRSLSIKKIANDCGIPQSVLHGWINGTLPSAKNLHLVFKLANYLGFNIEELLFGRNITNAEALVSLHRSSFVNDGTKYLLTIKKVSI